MATLPPEMPMEGMPPMGGAPPPMAPAPAPALGADASPDGLPDGVRKPIDAIASSLGALGLQAQRVDPTGTITEALNEMQKVLAVVGEAFLNPPQPPPPAPDYPVPPGSQDGFDQAAANMMLDDPEADASGPIF